MMYRPINLDKIRNEYLKVEKSFRAYFDKHFDCANCDPIDCCCRNTAEDGEPFFNHIIFPWEVYVLDKTFPQWSDYIDDNDGEKEFCTFFTDKGCMIPEGRPTICTTAHCDKYKDIVTEDVSAALDNYNDISKLMNRYMVRGVDIVEETDFFRNLETYFKIIENVVNTNDSFPVKYEYEAIA